MTQKAHSKTINASRDHFTLRRRFAVPLIACFLLFSAAPGSATLSSAPTIIDSNAHDGFVREQQIGGLTKMNFSDGSSLFTHGADEAPPPPSQFNSLIESRAAGKESVICVPETEKHFEVIVATAADDLPPTPSQIKGQLHAVYQASAYLDAEANDHKEGARARFRVLCDESGEALVKVVRLDTPKAEDTFWTIVDDLKLLGFNSKLAKYLIFYEDCITRGTDKCSKWAQGTIHWDDRASSRNWNNFGPSYAMDFGYYGQHPYWYYTLHEAGHTMGAVQGSAPNSSGSSHCNDGPDIMCYQDGGSKSGAYTNEKCTTSIPWALNPKVQGGPQHSADSEGRFDCHGDDYFNPDPAPGNYLDDNWNLAAPYNEFLYPTVGRRSGGRPANSGK